MKESTLLELDGYGNVLLGLPLLVYPRGVAQLLGIQYGDHGFYPITLGAVLTGVGIALLVERFGRGMRGLGLAGAMTINLAFGIVLGIWLVGNGAALPLRGSVLLWLLVVALTGVSVLEWLSVSKSNH